MLGLGTGGLIVMYVAAIIGAGVVGILTLLSPRIASKYVFSGDVQVDVYLRILGAIWLALGFVACLGAMAPERYLAVLLIQLIYKTSWLLAAAYPAIAKGNRAPGLVFLTCLFTVWVIALLGTIPFDQL